MKKTFQKLLTVLIRVLLYCQTKKREASLPSLSSLFLSWFLSLYIFLSLFLSFSLYKK